MDRSVRILLAALLTVTGVVILSPVGYVAAGGMVVNQSFEQGEDAVPYAWDITGNAERVSTEPIYVGSWAAVIDEDGETLTQWIESAEAVVNYEVWGWIHVSGNVTGVITVDFWEGQEGRQLSATRMLLGDEGEVRFDEIGVWPPGGGFWDWLNERCFVATAAYGTETTPELDILRDFRDQVLLENGAGSAFVDAYYKLSPPVANFIVRNDFMRAIVREVLVDPLVHLLGWAQGLWRA